MAVDTSSEIKAFQDFLSGQIQNATCILTPEESVAAFRRYQRDLGRFKADVQPAIDQLSRSEGRQLDYEKLKGEVPHHLVEEGIVD